MAEPLKRTSDSRPHKRRDGASSLDPKRRRKNHTVGQRYAPSL